MFSLFNKPREYPKYYEEFYDTFDFYNGRDIWLGSIASIPEEAVFLFAVHWTHLEIHNGGFAQFFWNSTGTLAPEAVEAFRAIGMPDVAQIVGDAMSAFGDPYPVEKSAREAILEAQEDDSVLLNALDQMTDTFYDLADTEEVFRRQPKFVPFAEEYAARAAASGRLMAFEG